MSSRAGSVSLRRNILCGLAGFMALVAGSKLALPGIFWLVGLLRGAPRRSSGATEDRLEWA